MDMITDVAAEAPGLTPFSLKDAPSLIERVFPAQKVGIEAQKERKSNATQTLTALGSYWKGRKPLVLVRACVLACLLPATENPDGDLELFESIMAMDLAGLLRREPVIGADLVWSSHVVSQEEKAAHLAPIVTRPGRDAAKGGKRTASTAGQSHKIAWKPIEIDDNDAKVRSQERARIAAERQALRLRAFSALPFSQQVALCDRVERLERINDADDPLYAGIWHRVNSRLGTAARTIPELVEQLGVARFGRRPFLSDPFSGGGSIPFEASRSGCDVLASDLNPVAAMLTWGALNVVGAGTEARNAIRKSEARIRQAVDERMTRLQIEHNDEGERAKSFLYCMEVVDPQTGWLVPMAPSWIISRTWRCVAKLKPDYARKRFAIQIETDVEDADLLTAEVGTVQESHLVYQLAPIEGEPTQQWRVSIARLRGDGEGARQKDGARTNGLRRWALNDVAPRRPEWMEEAVPVLTGASPGAWVGGDIWQELLYCIRWVKVQNPFSSNHRPVTYFAAPNGADLERERRVFELVQTNLDDWQEAGFVPDMPIEPGAETTRLTRERGWTYWHHLFAPRQLLLCKLFAEAASEEGPASRLILPKIVNVSSRLCRMNPNGAGGEALEIKDTFSNQALNTLYNFGCRGFIHTANVAGLPDSVPGGLTTNRAVVVRPATAVDTDADLWIYDPPYADAIHYHEITEFFISWLKANPPAEFSGWTWDSRRPLAIKGKDEKFRTDMVTALRAMADRMPGNGIQVCMFTHQDAGVWADMAQIVWGAGLRVTAAWYVSTETTSELKKGGYVQGTVLLVLRKRQGDERAYKDELVLEVRGAVQRQVDLLTGLNQSARAHQRNENPFSDADLQMAGYAAALEVLTGYTHIEGVDMTREALRQRVKGQTGIVEEMIALAVQTATELMRPLGIAENLWERLVPTERFWLKMTEAEANRAPGQHAGKLDDYQNFAKVYRADGWDDLMADSTPNKARLKGAADFKRGMMMGHPFAGGLVRPVLYAVNELRVAAERDEDHNASGQRAINGLRDNLASWSQQRQQAMVMADWMGRMLDRHRPAEASAARTLAALIRTERLG